jgi:hypothetical protein
MKLLYAALAVLLTAGGPAPAYAGTRPARPPLPADVWVNPAAELGVTAGMARTYFNQYTATQFACSPAPDDNQHCLPVPCPSARMCLTIRYGVFADDNTDARFTAIYCTGSCLKAGLIEINPEGPLHTMWGYWTAYHHRLLMQQQFGIFTGLPAQSQCVSTMSHYSCSLAGFTAAEAQHLTGW